MHGVWKRRFSRRLQQRIDGETSLREVVIWSFDSAREARRKTRAVLGFGY